MKKLGKNIRIVREIRNLTQEALGKSVGYSQRHVSRIEKGEVPLKEECIESIATALNISTQKLIDFNSDSFLD